MAALTCWADFTEVCGVYQRATVGARSPGQHVAYAAGASDGNTIRLWLNQERTRAGLSGDALRRAIDEAGGKGNMLCRHSFSRSQWVLPTWFQWQALHRAWNARGNPEGRPYLQRDRSRTYDLSLAGDVADLRSEYDTLRCPFTAPPDGASNVWTAPTVPPTARLKDEDGHPHPCQKPLAFAERAVHASTRAGDVVLDPFAGTNRIAIACSRLPAPEARHAVGIEMDRRWLDAVRPLLHCAPGAAKPRQASLFGRAP